MDIKKYGIIYALVGIAGVLLAINMLVPSFKSANLSPSFHPLISTSISGNRVMVDYGDKQATYSGIQAPNVYLALVEAVKQDGLEVETKQYDFGLMVEKIGEVANNQEFFWSYSVNGQMGEVAADNKLLAAGDTIEWKYIKITKN